jgi:hypothetical protein
METRDLGLAVVLAVVVGGCAAASSGSSGPSGASTARCVTNVGTSCTLRVPAAVGADCACEGGYGSQPGKVVE